MQLDIERFIWFYDYVRVSGTLVAPGSGVKALFAVQNGKPVSQGQITPDGRNFRFLLSFAAANVDPQELWLVFELDNGLRVEITAAEAGKMSAANDRSRNQAENKFFKALKQPGFDRVLEIGSRARSGVIRKAKFEGKQYTGIDILEGPNVDVVGDAHQLSAHFGPASFDAVFSIWTFEHLAMPWKVAVELNHVLREGGVAYIETHQTVGMHDMPWDFWRFSDTAWDALFNEYTGFRKVETFLGSAMHLVPMVYHDYWKGCEATAGFAESAVMIEKTGPCAMAWDVDVLRAIRGAYPA
jgi:hypothetical protein